MTVFERMASYAFIHHRALNSFSALDGAKKTAAAFPERCHVVEGDVCWNFEGGRQDLYFRHPHRVIDTLSAAEIDAGRKARSLVMLEDMLALKGTGVFFVIELKVGRGDCARAMERLVAFLRQHFDGRFWIDGFSLRLLGHIKRHGPDVPTTLHTECVWRGRVFAGAPEWPPLRIRRLDSIKVADGISIRWRIGAGFMARAVASVQRLGKPVFVSRIHDLSQYRATREWNVNGGYIHFDFAALMTFDATLAPPARPVQIAAPAVQR